MSIESIVAGGRRMAASTFLDSATVQDRTTVRDSSGGQRVQYTPRPEPIPCAFGTVTDPDLAGVAGLVIGKAKAVLRCPLDVQLDEGARVISALDGSIWNVVGDRTPPSNLATMRRFVIQEL